MTELYCLREIGKGCTFFFKQSNLETKFFKKAEYGFIKEKVIIAVLKGYNPIATCRNFQPYVGKCTQVDEVNIIGRKTPVEAMENPRGTAP